MILKVIEQLLSRIKKVALKICSPFSTHVLLSHTFFFASVFIGCCGNSVKAEIKGKEEGDISTQSLLERN